MIDKIQNVPTLRFSEFDADWSKATLGKIAFFSKGKGISKSEIDINGTTECIRYGELYTTYSETIRHVFSRTSIPKEELVLSGRNDIIIPASGEDRVDIATASCVLRSGIALGGDLNIIKTKLNGIFLSYYLNSKRKLDIARLAQGVSVVHLYSTQLASLVIFQPNNAEQEKIGAFLGSVDQKIEKLSRKKELLSDYKKGMMQKLFTQEIRFKDDTGNDFPKWGKKKLSDLLFEHKNRNFDLNFNKSDVLSVSGVLGIVNQIEHLGRSYAGEKIDNYHVVNIGDIVYTKSPLKSNPFGIIKTNKKKAGIVSTLYAVYSCKKTANPIYLDYYFSLHDNTNRYLRPLVHKGAKNDMKINNQRVLIDPISIPKTKEQQKIVDFLSALDRKIEAANKQLGQATKFKQGLLQQMFV